MLHIEHDQARCTGLGICESIDPDTFEVGDDGVLVLLRATVAAGDRAVIEEAVAACPTRALRVVPSS